MTLAQADPVALWVGVVTIAISLITGAIIMAWKLGGLNTTVNGLGDQLRANTARLDVIDAKADAAKETATAAVATATAAVSTATSAVRREHREGLT